MDGSDLPFTLGVERRPHGVDVRRCRESIRVNRQHGHRRAAEALDEFTHLRSEVETPREYEPGDTGGGRGSVGGAVRWGDRWAALFKVIGKVREVHGADFDIVDCAVEPLRVSNDKPGAEC